MYQTCSNLPPSPIRNLNFSETPNRSWMTLSNITAETQFNTLALRIGVHLSRVTSRVQRAAAAIGFLLLKKALEDPRTCVWQH